MKFEFKKDINIGSDGFHYDLFLGGGINPSAMLENEEQAKAVNSAVKLIQSFLDQAEEAGVLESY
jgi:hypothetical protein